MLDFNFTNLLNVERIVFGKKPDKFQELPVVRRIQSLLESHDLKFAQLLSVVPREWGWTLASISDGKSLLASINTDVLDWFAQTFDVNRAWLEEASDQIHESFSGYKHLDIFFNELSDAGWVEPALRMTILAEDYNSKHESLCRYAIVFSLPAIELELTDKTIYRHRLFESVWDFHHPPCLMDTKAVARWFSMRHNHLGTIPIIPVNNRSFQDIADGRRLLSTAWTTGIGSLDRFEDRILFKTESSRAKKTRGLEEIVTYLNSVVSNY